MKRVFVQFVMAGLLSVALAACGGKQEEGTSDAEGDEDPYGAYETAPAKGTPVEELIAQGKALTDASDCKTCHHQTNKLIGPSHTAVAEKYEFTQANVTYLAGKIRDGGQGVWGEIPMTAHPDISPGEAEKMAMYVLSLDGEKPKDIE